MEYSFRDPKPPPRPVCNNNCGQVLKEGPEGIQITCPCGYGYYDEQRKVFIPGSLVRAGKAPTREQYIAHVRQCPEQQEGSPVVAHVFLGVHKEEENVTTPPEDTRHRLFTHRRVHSPPSPEPKNDVDQENIDTNLRRKISAERTNLNTNVSQGNTVFIPREDIELETLVSYLRLYGRGGVQLRDEVKNGKPGWTMTGFDLNLELSEWKEVLSDIVKDSRAWVRECRRSIVLYPDSKAAKDRLITGPVALQCLSKQSNFPIKDNKAIQQLNRNLPQTIEVRHESTDYSIEPIRKARHTNSRLNASVRVAPRYNEKKADTQNRIETSNDTPPVTVKTNRHMKTDSGISGVSSPKSTPPRKETVSDNQEESSDTSD